MPWHLSPVRNVRSINAEGLKPAVGPRSEIIGESDARVHLFSTFDDLYSADRWLEDAVDEDQKLALFHVAVPRQDGAWTELAEPVPADKVSLINIDYGKVPYSPALAALDRVENPFGNREDFRATRVELPGRKFGDVVGDAQWEDDPDTRFLVYGAAYYIEILKDGRFLLPLVAESYIAESEAELAGLEDKLFDYMMSERGFSPEGDPDTPTP